jgi:Zn-dependent protease
MRSRLFEIFGFKLKVDPSWLLIAALIVWSLSTSYFPPASARRSASFYTVLGIIAMLGMFISLILHELSHSLVARSHGLGVGGITLFIFGGVAELEEEPHDPKSEFQIAIAGSADEPVACGYVLWRRKSGRRRHAGNSYAGAVFGYLALINLVLAVFNLFPGVSARWRADAAGGDLGRDAATCCGPPASRAASERCLVCS